jgi:hypothetical protein
MIGRLIKIEQVKQRIKDLWILFDVLDTSEEWENWRRERDNLIHTLTCLEFMSDEYYDNQINYWKDL